MRRYMLISLCNSFLCTDAERMQSDREDVGLCQKNVKTGLLSGSTTPRGTVLLLAPKAKMYLSTIVRLLAKAIGRCLKGRRSNLLPLAAIKAGKRQKYLQLDYWHVCRVKNVVTLVLPGTRSQWLRWHEFVDMPLGIRLHCAVRCGAL